MRAASVAVRGRACFVSSWRISHFGRNPVSGGRPPKDRRIKGVTAVMIGIFVQEEARALMLVALFSFKTRNIEKVMTKYVIKARSVREGENWTTRTIHPRCAIEEYAKIFRSCVWFKPPQPPIRVDARPSIMSIVGLAG